MTIKQAAAQAREFAHGSSLHQDAMSVLFQGYRSALPSKSNQFITLESLWGWVDGYLQMEEASQGSVPLG